MHRHPLYALDRHSSLAVQLVRVSLVALLLAVLQAGALVVLQHSVLAAVVAIAEAAVTDNSLSRILAVLERASDLLGRHSTSKRQCYVQCGVGLDVVGLKRRVGCGEVLAGVDDAEVFRRWVRGAEGQERAQGIY